MLPKYKIVFAALTLSLAAAAVYAGSAKAAPAKASASAAAAPAVAPTAAATPAAAAAEVPATEATIVYLAGSGSRYHTKDCRYLNKKPGKQISIGDAMKQGYAPCNVCKAPRVKRN